MKINSKFTRIVGVGLSTAMLATTVLTAVPVMADVSGLAVTMNNTGISQSAAWDIRFTATNAIKDAVNANITITFPSGFSVNNSGTLTDNTTGVTIGAGVGWTDTITQGPAVLSGVTINGTAATRRVIVHLAATDVIGAGADVRIILPVGLVTNPSAAGSTNITVATSNDTTAVTSNNIVITLPFVGPLPGVVEGKNSVGDVLVRVINSDLSSVITTPGVSRIELASGTYNATNVASVVNQTIIGVGAAGTVILTNAAGATPLSITAAGVVIQDLTIAGNSANTFPGVTASANATIRNVTFSGGNNQLVTSGTAVVTVENSRFNVTGNVSRGLDSAYDTRVTASNFTVDSSGTGIRNTGNLTLSGVAITGSGTSTGISISGAGATFNNTEIRNSTLTTLREALVVSNAGANVSVTGNTITGGGESTASDTRGAAVTQSAGALSLLNNTISNSNAAYYALHVSGGDLMARFNNITGNTLNARQTGGTLNATLNWWGSASGPSASSLNATTSSALVTSPYLGGIANNGVIAFGSSNLTARTSAGVDVSTANGSFTYASAARYAANPQSTAPTGTPIAYYDVAFGVTAGAEPSSITIRFYANVTADTKVYYGGGLAGAWSLAGTQGVNTASGFAFVTITGTSAPAFSDMGGTPFVLTNIISAPAAPSLTSPTGTGIPLNTGFEWTPATGATSYNFQVSTVPTFATTVASQTGLTSTVSGGVALTSNTTYFWRVQAVNAGGSSAWATGTFTTAGAASGTTTPPPAVTVNVTPQAPVINVAPPNVTVQPPAVTINPPQVTVAAPPPANVTVNPPTVNVAPPPPANVQVNVPESGPIIPTYILWTIILIGAVLVIALIVLIVRTRRVA